MTRVSVFAATGATALIGVVIAQEHAGSSNTATTGGSTLTDGSGVSTPTTTTTPGSTNSSGSQSSSSSGFAPSMTPSTPAVTSGGSSR